MKRKQDAPLQMCHGNVASHFANCDFLLVCQGACHRGLEGPRSPTFYSDERFSAFKISNFEQR